MVPKRCRWCGTKDTSLWRFGEDEMKSLCNNCGLQYQRHDASAGKEFTAHRENRTGSAEERIATFEKALKTILRVDKEGSQEAKGDSAFLKLDALCNHTRI
ncbi:hypothetical protein WJX73_007455 [Symbiochloris irregularis]|uniref:GATA-type domain-containing protein n=1 Tax=Symbiochloris irregularis TaxID=706552 RepID=A0AAW1NR10_9CHLO